jgi:hypothetical protein
MEVNTYSPPSRVDTIVSHYAVVSESNNQPLYRHSHFHVDADEHLTCPIRISIEDGMHVQTLTVPGATPRPLLSRALSRDSFPLKLSYLLAHTSN